MAVGRISGPLLKANLLRDGVDLAFETDLLYLDVVNGRVGIKTTTPSDHLTVNGTSRTNDLIVDNQADLATFTILGNTISSSSSTINLEPTGANPVVYQAKIQVDDLTISGNTIESLDDITIRTNGTGVVNIHSNVEVDGNVHATGTITADGNIIIGNADTDSVSFNAEIISDIVPDVHNTYMLGSPTKKWADIYVENIIAQSITTDDITVDGINLILPQGNILYVSKNGNDTNSGTRESDPYLTVKYALSQATSGTTVYIYPGVYEEQFPLTVPVGVSIRGAGIRATKISPTTATRYNDAFLLNGETLVEELTVADFYSGGNFYTVTAASAGSTTVNVGTAPFAHAYVSGGTVTIGATNYNITNAVYTHTTGVLVLTHTGGTATLGDSVFVSNLTFSCNGGNRIFPDNGYAFRFATDFTVSSRSPYLRNLTVITKGSVVSGSDPRGFDAGNAGKGAYIDGAYATPSSKEASMLFHSVTFITPGVDGVTATNGARVEWLNSFTYFANKSLHTFASNDGFASQGKTRLRINDRVGTWAPGNTLTYYDTDGTTVLASGVIDSIDGDFVNINGKSLGFETLTDRTGKIVFANGNAKLSTVERKFGTASLVLDGTGDFVNIASQPDFEFSTDDFCIEAWIYPTTSGTYQTLFDFRTSSGDTSGIILGLTNLNALYFYYNGNYRVGPAGTVSLNTWTHIALSRTSGTTKAFINGTQVGVDYTDANSYPARPLRIGADPNGLYTFTGYIDEVRISRGVSRYSTTFVTPTAAFSGDASTFLLLHFNGTNNSTLFVDDGLTTQDLRTSAGGTSKAINFADYNDFGAEVRSIGSAAIYGNYGVYANGVGCILYLISENFAYIGAGKKSNNDPVDRIAANEVVELNSAKVYYTSVDNEGNFKVGDSFFVNQKTGEVLFNNQIINVTSTNGFVFTDGSNTTTINAQEVSTGNIKISGNTIESLTGEINVVSANGQINVQDVRFNNNTIQTTTTNLDLVLQANGTGNVVAEGIQFNNNNIQSVSTDTNITLTPQGTGSVIVNSQTSLQIPVGTTLERPATPSNGMIRFNTTMNRFEGWNGTYWIQLGGVQDIGGSTYIKPEATPGANDNTLYFYANNTLTATINQTELATTRFQTDSLDIVDNTISSLSANQDIKFLTSGTGGVRIGNLKFRNNAITNTVPNAVTEIVQQGTGYVKFAGTGGFAIPVGNSTTERPANPIEGMMRYNSDFELVEVYNGQLWTSVAGTSSGVTFNDATDIGIALALSLG